MSGKNISKNVSYYESNQFWRTIAIGAFVVIAFLSLPQLCSADCGHSHDHHDHHHHHEEPASFKWSKQANEAIEGDSDHHQHHHHHGEELHDHGHHSHGHAAHSHGSHSHAAHSEKSPKNAQSELKTKRKIANFSGNYIIHFIFVFVCFFFS